MPFPPGGATDAIARIIQDSMSQSLGQPIVIENIGGAGGIIASARAARAAPDGYTIMIHQVALAAGMTLYPNLTFDAEKDFVTIGLINNAASTWAARPTLPPNNIAEMVKWMKAPGQNTKIAHAGVGSFGHLAGVLVAQEIGATVTQVPYRGAGPALNDLLAGVVDLSSISAVLAGPLVKAGKIKAYAIIGRNRFAGLPELPTLGEVGYKKLDLDFWHMLLAPAGTPRPIVDRLNAALRHALADATGQEDVCRRRHGSVSGRAGNARGRGRIAQERDQALGRRDPRQQHPGDSSGYSAALSTGGWPERNCSSSAASSALAATRWRALTGPKPRIFSGMAASPTA